MPSVPTRALDPRDWTSGPVADMFSAYVAASALSAAHELGLLDRLAATGTAALPGRDGDSSGGLDPGVLRRIWATLSWAQIVEIDAGRVAPSRNFDAAYAARGYFYWLVRGNGQMFAAAPGMAGRDQRQGRFYHRDMRAVALGSQLIGDTEVEGLFDKLIADVPARTVVDLGCGSAHRLLRIARDHPDVRGIGIDISGEAVQVASDAVAAAGLGRQVSVRQADVRALDPDPEYADADTVLCVFMGHDFWPFPDCVRTLRRLRSVFPAAQRLLLCDVARTTGPPGPGTAIFTLGFEFAHALMGVYLPDLAEWREAFAAGGWHCAAVQPTTAPPNGFLFQLTPVGPE
jgi:phenylpyruvate C(3)-methyltransferase